MTKKYNIAVVGATGNVGHETLQILASRDFPVNKVYALASSKSLGKRISFGEDGELDITDLEGFDFSKVDIAFFSAGSEIAEKYAPIAASKGAIVIDKSSFFRMNPQVPLIVPEANLASLHDYSRKNIVANPNCCTIPLVVALKPLDNAVKIKRLVISTWQSASGAGKRGMEELYEQTKAKYIFEDPEPKIFPKPIAFNVIPYIGKADKDGYSDEETKIAAELTKIMGDHIKSSLTCVRVPVFLGHSMAVNVEFGGEMDVSEISEILDEADGVQVIRGDDKYMTPIEIVGEDNVFISRIRPDYSQENTINFWLTADNLRKGAALNAVQIAEELIKEL